MKKFLSFILLTTIICACNNAAEDQSSKISDTTDKEVTPASIKEVAVDYSSGGTQMKGYVYFDENRQGPRPVILVLPEWWGLTDYPRMRAKMLAESGYLAMAVDMYGDGKVVETPEDAQAAATPFYQNPQMGRERVDAALAKAVTFPQADSTRTAAIGYCFGGSMVLHSAVQGSNLDGVVSFHGGLEGIRAQQPVSARMLVCHGGADPFVPEAHVTAFKNNMDSAGVNYSFKVYPGATHAFTNPDATKKGAQFNMPIRYHAAADSASWQDMKAFLNTLFSR